LACSREPFSIAPDPRFLFMSVHERHREALAHLLYGVGGGGGFVLLTGEIGAGKTTVGRCFLEQIAAPLRGGLHLQPQAQRGRTAADRLRRVRHHAWYPGEASIKAHVDALNRFLLDAHAQGRQALLVIDEAQSLSADVLEQLRLLTNLETAERKLLQIMLIGQPELRDMLAQPGWSSWPSA
jgi:general secretion pathway protein A